jgi:hypothetical protein
MLDRGHADFREVITGEVRRIHIRRPDLGVSKRPITPVRPVTIAINRLDTLQKPTGPPPVRPRTWPVNTAELRISNSDPPANGGDPLHPGQE